MNLKDSVLEIPELVKQLKEFFAEKVELKFTDAKLQDGTIVSYDGEVPMAGVSIFVIDTAGQRLPAPDGEHVFEDGTIVQVVGGVIKEVKQAAPSSEPKAPEEMQDNQTPNQNTPMTPAEVKSIIETVIKETVFSKEEMESKMAEKMLDIPSKFEAIEKENTALKAEVEKLSALLKETFSIVEKIASAPSVEPTKKKDGFMIEEKVSDREKDIEEFRKKYLKEQF